MKKKINSYDIFNMAQRIEENGERFYKQAAKLYPTHKSLFLELAAQETDHREYFKKLKEMACDADGQNEKILAPYFAAIADGVVFDDPEHTFKGVESVEEILQIAVEREGDSILFYLGLKEYVDNEEDKIKISEVIKEEMRHVEWLHDYEQKMPARHPLL